MLVRPSQHCQTDHWFGDSFILIPCLLYDKSDDIELAAAMFDAIILTGPNDGRT